MYFSKRLSPQIKEDLEKKNVYLIRLYVYVTLISLFPLKYSKARPMSKEEKAFSREYRKFLCSLLNMCLPFISFDDAWNIWQHLWDDCQTDVEFNWYEKVWNVVNIHTNENLNKWFGNFTKIVQRYDLPKDRFKGAYQAVGELENGKQPATTWLFLHMATYLMEQNWKKLKMTDEDKEQLRFLTLMALKYTSIVCGQCAAHFQEKLKTRKKGESIFIFMLRVHDQLRAEVATRQNKEEGLPLDYDFKNGEFEVFLPFWTDIGAALYKQIKHYPIPAATINNREAKNIVNQPSV